MDLLGAHGLQYRLQRQGRCTQVYLQAILLPEAGPCVLTHAPEDDGDGGHARGRPHAHHRRRGTLVSGSLDRACRAANVVCSDE